MNKSFSEVLLVMPAKNEEATIGETIREAREALDGIHILVINDGSTDNTSKIARIAGASVLDLPFNLGVGGAMRLGFRYAYLNGYKIMIQLDSDGQHNPKDVPSLIKHLDKANVVIGSRFAGKGDYTASGPRMFAIIILSKILSKLTKSQLSDTTSGFKAHDLKAIEIYRQDFPAEYLGDTVEAIVIGHRAGLKFQQQPVSMRQRAGGEPSQNSFRSAIYLGRAFIALSLALIRPQAKL